jgi:hypothetical protein
VYDCLYVSVCKAMDKSTLLVSFDLSGYIAFSSEENARNAKGALVARASPCYEPCSLRA